MDRDEALLTVRDGDRESRRAAVRALWQWSRFPDPAFADAVRSSDVRRTLDALTTAVTDADPLVRGHAVATLGELLFAGAHDQPLPELDAVLGRLTDDDEAVRQTVTGLLWNREWWGGFDAQDHPATSEQRRLGAVGLVACLDDPVWLTRKRASHALEAALVFDHPDRVAATASLVSALGDEQEQVRTNVAALLADVATRCPELLDRHGPRLRRVMTGDESITLPVAAALAKTVGRNSELATPVVDAVLDAEVESAAHRERQLSIIGDVLVARPDGFDAFDRALAELASALSDDGDRQAAGDGNRQAAAATVRRVAATAPAAVRSLEPAVRALLASPDETIRQHGACALADIVDSPEADQSLAALVDRYGGRPPGERVPDPLVELAPAHPEFVREQLEAMRERTPNPPHDTRLTVADILDTAPGAVHPVLEQCAADLDAEDPAVRNGAAWLLGQQLIEHPGRCQRYESAVRAAADAPERFDRFAHRKLQSALDALDDAAE